MARYAAGDARALEALLNITARRVLAFLRCREPDAARAEALLEATFVRLHVQRRAYRPGTSTRVWVFRAAAETQAGATADARPTASAERATRNPGHGAEVESGASDTTRAVREAVETLSASQRQVIHLHRFECMCFAEIAQVFDASESVIRDQAYSGYRQLGARLRPLVGHGEMR